MYQNSELENYMKNGHPHIEGWIQPDYVVILEQLDLIQRRHGNAGGGGEIGVHHGRSFIPMAILKKDGKCLAIDVFENQELNVDRSGRGDFAIFSENVKKWLPDSHVTIFKGDSGFMPDEFIDSFVRDNGTLSYFSIDGGHTAENTFSDILLATRFIGNGSVMVLDDYYNQDWPGVHEGFLKYLNVADVKFFPLCYGFGKMVLCARSWHNIYLCELYAALEALGLYKLKKVALLGHLFLSVKK